ncbi:hypothetical protein QJS10_CPB13g01090 [Acorus calamus]|uniref:FAR1 domain-containing protein n=1 Tax=Acorus calamus TaxID=4465 RepID=A0AAV9DEF5_ACOCL|nr:hypothetical protein QJS10_CPB13g01090 [Acorus calamus]
MEMNDLKHIGVSVEAEPQAAVNRDEEAEYIRHYEANEELIIGMEFNSIDEAFSQYKAFAFRCGFGIMRSGRRFTPDGGKLRKKKDESSTMTSVSQTRYKPTCKTNCKAMMQIRTFGDEKWDELRQLIQLNHACIGDKNDCKTYEVIEIVKTNHGENKRLRFDVLYKGATEEELKAKTTNHIWTLIDTSLPYQPNTTAQSTNRASNIINNEKVRPSQPNSNAAIVLPACPPATSRTQSFVPQQPPQRKYTVIPPPSTYESPVPETIEPVEFPKQDCDDDEEFLAGELAELFYPSPIQPESIIQSIQPIKSEFVSTYSRSNHINARRTYPGGLG